MPMRGAQKSKAVMKSCKGEATENMRGSVGGIEGSKMTGKGRPF